MKHSPLLDAQVVLGTFRLLVSGGTEGKKRRGSDYMSRQQLPAKRAHA